VEFYGYFCALCTQERYESGFICVYCPFLCERLHRLSSHTYLSHVCKECEMTCSAIVTALYYSGLDMTTVHSTEYQGRNVLERLLNI